MLVVQEKKGGAQKAFMNRGGAPVALATYTTAQDRATLMRQQLNNIPGASSFSGISC